MDVSTIATVASIALAVATFCIGRFSAHRSDGKELGTIITNIKYIRESLDKIGKVHDSDISRIDMHVDNIDRRTTKLEVEVKNMKEAKTHV